MAGKLANQIRGRAPPVQRIEDAADRDIAMLFEMQAIIAAAVMDRSRCIAELSAALADLADLVREQGRGK